MAVKALYIALTDSWRKPYILRLTLSIIYFEVKLLKNTNKLYKNVLAQK